MNENIVQWVLLKETNYLQRCLGNQFILKKKLVEEYNTDYGRIDFAFETINNEIVIVELETAINNKSKLDYCINQAIRYTNIKSTISRPTHFIILYDKDNTPKTFEEKLKLNVLRHGILLKTYSMLNIQELYRKCLDDLKRTAGLSLGKPIAMNVTSLKQINKIISLFDRENKNKLVFRDVKEEIGSPPTYTTFNVHLRLSEDFDIIKKTKIRGVDVLELTELGKEFKNNLNYNFLTSRSRNPELSVGQKRVLLRSLLNGHLTKSKVNIYYFLRFIHLTEGEWVPKPTTNIDESKLKFINDLLGTCYNMRTARRFMSFTCNQCEELGLVEKIKLPNKDYHKVTLTTLGSRVLGFLELYLHLKREEIQIPIQLKED